MATDDISIQLAQLGDARKLVLADPSIYGPVISGILPIVGGEGKAELRRWGADFLAETFANPDLPSKEKETLCLQCLDTLKVMIEREDEDVAVQKSVIQCAASIYPLVVKWIISNGYDRDTWDRMTAIKAKIFRIWDTAKSGVRMCCIKFAQRVVLAQTPGISTESGRGGHLDISLLMVPKNHTLIPPRNLEAEASGLLDRLLSVFHENAGDAVIIDATLNSVSILIRSRPSISNKILTAILSFNPLKLANSPMTPKLRVMVKSMEKTTRQLLIHVNKRDPQNTLASRIHQHIERLMRSRTEIFDEAPRKRGHPESFDNLETSKRARMNADTRTTTQIRLPITPFTPGPHTIAELFTLSNDSANIDASGLHEDLVVKLGISVLQHGDLELFRQAIEAVRNRYERMPTALVDISQLNPDTAPLGVEEDEDDDGYEPDFEVAEDTEQILNKLDSLPKEAPEQVAGVAIGIYKLPSPPVMTNKEVLDYGQSTIQRVFSVIPTLEDSASRKAKTGINRLAASTYDKDAWITVITRIATRAQPELEETMDTIKEEYQQSPTESSLSDTIREALYMYVVDDFKNKIDIAVSWLCEEWYNDRIQSKKSSNPLLHYEKWTMRVLDGILPYVDARDKYLTRFLSEIPSLSAEALNRIKSLCRDPAMVNLALTTFLYLVMMRPPVKEIALDAVEDVWRTYDDAKPMAAKYLSKYRPLFMEKMKDIEEDQKKLVSVEGLTNGGPTAISA